MTRDETSVLNALIYIETDLWDTAGGADGGQPKTLGEIVSELKNHDFTENSGGMTPDECRQLFEAVDNRETLKQLELFNVGDSDYEEFHTQKSDAPIVTFMNGGNPVVVFRGTEPGTDEEIDNILGAVASDTDAQQRALGYITILHDKYGFDNISVTGHSKGGNKAMYVTVLSDYVTECSAVDGQGFSAAFLAKYAERIEKNRDKITLIAPDRAVVGSLLYSIAGNEIYLSTEGLDQDEWKLGFFAFHKPNTLFTIDAGYIRMREGSGRSQLSIWIGGFTQSVSALASGAVYGAEVFPELSKTVLGNYTEGAGRVMENWLNGIRSDGSPAFSAQIMNFLGSLFPGLRDIVTDELRSLSDGPGSGPDILTVMQSFGERLPLLASRLAESAASAGGIAMAVGGGPVVTVVAATVVAWAFVKALELAVPLLLNAGIAISVASGYALGLAASWVWEILSGIGAAAKEGFGRAVDGLVRLGSLAADAARSAKNAIADAVGRFVDRAAGFLRKLAEGASAWIQGIFGSAGAAIAYAQDIDVTMSRIEEMRSCLGNLRQCYVNAGNAAVGARQVTDRVSSYYHESYVRSCCGDIQYHLKSAGSLINSAERTLEKKRRILAEAAEAYRRSDKEAAETIGRYAYG